MERTIRNLAEMKDRVYLYFATQKGAIRFQHMAEDEGFTFGDGAKPTERECAEIMAINHDNTINFVGHIGTTAFMAGAKKIGNEGLIRVDFDKYVSGEKDFFFKQNTKEHE